MSKVPDLHHRILRERAAKVHPGDLEMVRRLYTSHEATLNKPSGFKMIDRLYLHIRALNKAMENPDGFSPEQLKIAIAALKYFFADEDHIPDDALGATGLVDDALVVEAAVEELGSLLDL